MVFVGSSFVYGLLGSADLLPKLGELESFLQQLEVVSAEEDRARAAKKAAKDDKAAADGAVAPAASSPAPAAAAAGGKAKQLVRTKDTVSVSTKEKGKKVTQKISGLCEIVVFEYKGHQEKLIDWFKQNGFAAGSEQ